MWLEEPFLPRLAPLPSSHHLAPSPLLLLSPLVSATIAAFSTAAFSTAAVTADTMSRWERSVADTGAAAATATAATAAEVMAGDGSLSVSNYSTQAVSNVLNPPGPFICY